MQDSELLQEVKHEDLRVFLADIVAPKIPKPVLDDRMRELENLVTTYGGLVLLQKFQRREMPDFKTYIGKGKLQEIIAEMQVADANLLIIGNILKPRQLYAIAEELRPHHMKVWDRVDLILKIFGKHAEGMESRLQIELASIKHMWPRIFGMWLEMSRQGAGIWTSWIWETNTERMKRHLKEKQFKIRKKLAEYAKMRELHRQSRKKKNFPTVGIVWYTNAGKSSLLTIATKKKVLVEDKLFATLGTNVGKMFVFTDMEKWIGKEILLNDTIGFIRELPPQLIDAFSSTLEDSIESDILLHVIDASDPFIFDRIDVVNNILDTIGATQPRYMVFNKIDLINTEQLSELKKKFPDPNNQRISVHNAIGIEELKFFVAKKV